MKWIMDSYQALPKEQGAKIQDVLNSQGVKNINDVTPAMYPAIVAGVNLLKG
jgi:hypothetical protein